MKKKSENGFTLAELLVVVAIIGVLVAVSIPIFTSKLHEARVATDWANVRSYYSELQADYISTDKYNDKVPVNWDRDPLYDWTSITFLNGTKVKLKDGICAVSFVEGRGYSIEYQCNSWHTDCHLSINTQN